MVVVEFLLYWLKLLVGTLGLFVVCGLLIHLISHWFARLIGFGSKGWFYATSVIGTPVHELGHAVMCKLFGHRITRMKLWNPKPDNGVYGFVEHSYSRKNVWAKFGNMFIGMGPLFSGLGVIVLALWFCFPTLWSEYLASTSAMIPAGEAALHFETVSESLFALVKGIFVTFSEDWLKSSIGLLVILSVALHISLSPQDIKGSLGALPIYCGLLLLVTCALFWTPFAGTVLSWVTLLNLRLFSLFALTVAFALVWLAFAALVRFIKIFISWF